MLRKLAWLGLPLLSLLTFAADNTSDRLIQEALKPSPLASNLRRLTDEVGGRVPGTPAMQHAVDWGVAAFKDAGADSVHTEEFTIPTSWAEGSTSLTASMYAGAVFPIRAVSVAWAPALAAVKHVPIMDVGEGTERDFTRVGDVSGKLLLVHTKVLASWAPPNRFEVRFDSIPQWPIPPWCRNFRSQGTLRARPSRPAIPCWCA